MFNIQEKYEKHKKYYNYLMLFLLGCALFEFSSRLITHLEEKKDYSSILYNVLIWCSAGGAALAIVGIMNAYKIADGYCHTSFK